MDILETDRIILRGFEYEDLDDFYEYAKDQDVGPLAGWSPHKSKVESLEYLEVFKEEKYTWVIYHKEDKKVIGSIGINKDYKRKCVPNCYNLGYSLNKKYWGLGIMPESAKCILEYAFNKIKLDIITATHFSHNKQSKRVLEKIGFICEGTLRKAIMSYDNKEVYDLVCYSILKEDYRNII